MSRTAVVASRDGLQIGASRYPNPISVLFATPDLAYVVNIVISLLALLLTFDAITGELETGTLRLMLSNAVPRGRRRRPSQSAKRRFVPAEGATSALSERGFRMLGRGGPPRLHTPVGWQRAVAIPPEPSEIAGPAQLLKDRWGMPPLARLTLVNPASAR